MYDQTTLLMWIYMHLYCRKCIIQSIMGALRDFYLGVRDAINNKLKHAFPGAIAYAIASHVWNKKEIDQFSRKYKVKNKVLFKSEYSLYSQNGEDGILRYIFSEIGSTNKTFVEFGFGSSENNTLRLVLIEQWNGLYIDGSAIDCEIMKQALRYKNINRIKVVNAFLTRENINSVIKKSGLKGEIDLLSIDVDGIDYWLWEALSIINPRVVVIEYNASLGSTHSLTVPYDPTFDRNRYHPSGFYHGASVKALETLGKKKGYRLIGCDSSGTNAFFLRNEIARKKFPAIQAKKAYRESLYRINEEKMTTQKQYALINHMPYVAVKTIAKF